MQARIRVRDRHGSCPKQTVVLTIQFSSMEHHAFHVPYLLDTTPEAAFHGQAVKTVVYLRVSTTQQVLGPEARTPEGLAGRLTARWQAGRNPALPRTGRFQDRHRQVWTCPVPPSTAHEHPRAQAEPLACISTRILSVPSNRRCDPTESSLFNIYRTFPLRAPLRLSWPTLYRQFGVDPAKASDKRTVQNFRSEVLQELVKIKLAWPKLNYSTAKSLLIQGSAHIRVEIQHKGGPSLGVSPERSCGSG